MGEIKRFAVYVPAGSGGVVGSETVAYVLHSDHEAAIRELQLHAGALEHQMAELRDLCATLRHQSEKAQAVIREKDAEIAKWKDQALNWCKAEGEQHERSERLEDALLYKDAEIARWAALSVDLQDKCAKALQQAERSEAKIAALRLGSNAAATALLDLLRRAEAQRDEYKADAERYRWLRSRPGNDLDLYYITVERGPLSNVRWMLGGDDPEGCDAAIDAAMKEGK